MDRDGFLHRLGSASLIVISLLLIGTAYYAVQRIRAVHAGRLAATDAARVERAALANADKQRSVEVLSAQAEFQQIVAEVSAVMAETDRDRF